MDRFFTLLFLLLSGTYARAEMLSDWPAPEISGLSAESSGACRTRALKFSSDIAGPLNDSLPPVITCPSNVTLTLESASCDTVYTYTVTAEDDQPGVILAQVSGLHSGDPFPVGLTVNLFLAVDGGGNTATCSFSVQVIPQPGPPLLCKSMVTLTLGSNCMLEPTADQMLIPPFGCVGGYKVEADLVAPPGNGPWVPAVFGTSDLNKTYGFRVYEFTTGNNCWGSIKIVDSLPPVLDCPEVNIPCALPTTHLSPSFLRDSLGITNGMPIVLENCPGNPVLSFVDVMTNLPCDSPGVVTGYIRRFWTALDASNNVATCVQTINRTRSLDDVLFPANATVSCANPDTLPANTGGPYVQVGSRQYSLLTAPFCEIDAFYDDSLEMLCGGGRRIRRVWSVQDACRPADSDNPIFGTQYIDVKDLDGPVLQCPQDTVVVISAQNCVGAVDFPDVIVSDNCSSVAEVRAFWTLFDATQDTLATLGDFTGNDPLASDTLAVFGEIADYPVGITNLLYVATDICGNTASCEITLHVWNDTPPIAACEGNVLVLLNDKGVAAMPAQMADSGSSDDCSELRFKAHRVNAGTCMPSDTLFTDEVWFCCADASDTVDVLLRVYNVDIPSGIVSDSLANGQYADCVAHVYVSDLNPPDCTAPADVSVYCTEFDPTFALYGDAIPTCKVDSMTFDVDYTLFDTTCNRGIIVRKFHVFDSTGTSGQCSQELEVVGVQNYWIKFPDDVVAIMCDSVNSYGKPMFGNLSCENMVSTYTDEIFTVVPDACYKIERTWKIYNACTYDPNGQTVVIPNPNPHATVNHPSNLVGPVVSPDYAPAPWAPTISKIGPNDPVLTHFSAFWDSTANSYTYKQIIKIIDTEKPVAYDCPAGPVEIQDMTANDPQLWNESYWYSVSTSSQDLCEAPVDLCITVSDLCAGADTKVRFILYLDLDGDGNRETVVPSTNLPGFNNVQFGNAANPNFGGGISRQFDGRPVPFSQKYGFALQTTTSGRQKTACVRWNTQQSPNTYTTPSLPYGTHRIQWIAEDGCGNQTTCDYLFTIDDAVGLCAPNDLTIHGLIYTETGDGVSNVAIVLDGTHPALPPFTSFALTDNNGAYEFTVPAGSSFTVTPVRDDNPLNGVSTFDLLLINKHVLALEPFNSPYKIIAADANVSRSVTTFDIVEFRKLILGVIPQLSNNTSWRFIDSEYDFPNPANPFQGVFPETISVQNIQPDSIVNYDFIAVKVGDENGNVIPNIADVSPDDRAVFALTAGDALLQSGESVRVPVRVNASGELLGMQFALQFDPDLIEIGGLEPGSGLAAGLANGVPYFAQPAPGMLTFSWDDLSAPFVKSGETVFTLEVLARQPVQLSRAIRWNPAMLNPEAYVGGASGAAIRTLALEFSPAPDVPNTEIFPAMPNPSAGRVIIPLALAGDTPVRVQVFDLTGRQVYEAEQLLSAGIQRLEIPADAFGQTKGVFTYRVRAGAALGSGKLVRW